MPPNLGGFFMVRSYYPSECHADYFDFERIEALKPAIEACGISLIWLDLVASLPLIKERILVIILLLHFLSLMLGSVLVLMLPLLVWLTPDLRIKKSLLKC